MCRDLTSMRTFNIGASYCVRDSSGKSIVNPIITDSSSDLCLSP